MHITQWIFRAEQQLAGRVALENDGLEQTWQQTAGRIRRMGSFFQSLGVHKNDHVSILALNSALYYELVYAIPLIGARMVPQNTRWAAPELIYAINDSGSKALAFDAAFLPMVEKIRQEEVPVERYVYMGDPADCPDWATSLQSGFPEQAPFDKLIQSDDGIAGIYYTGGTTGFSKGVVQTHSAIYTSAIAMMSEMDVDETSIYCHIAPMFHMADLTATFGYTIRGAKHLFMPSFDPVKYMDTCQAKRVTDGLLVPAMIQMTFDHPEFDARKMKSVRRLSYGASPMSEGLVRRVIKAMPELRLMQAYGQTELAPVVTLLKPEDHVTEGERSYLLRSAGRATASSLLRIADEHGNPLPTGEVGEVCVYGPHAMLGYWNKPEDTARTLRDGWVHTGDAGYLDKDGYLFLVDRVKDMIVSGGENVYSTEVESAVSTHPSVAQVAVIGIPSEKWGEQVHAIIIPVAGAPRDAEAIMKHCREHIADYKCPKSVSFRDDPLPLTGAGKVLKRELREPYWKDKDRQVG